MRAWRAAILLTLAAALGCEGDVQTTSPAQSTQLRLEVVQWDSLQVATVERNITVPRVRVVDADGVPQARVEMQYAFPEQVPRTFTVESNRTDDRGEWGPAIWVPNRRAGTQAVLLYIAGATSGGAQRFSLFVRPTVPASLELDGDSIQVGVGAHTEPLTFAGEDPFGNPWDYVNDLAISTEDSSIARFTSDGRVQGVSEGRTLLLMQAGARTFSALIIVGNPPVLTARLLLPGSFARMALAGDGNLYAADWPARLLWRLNTTTGVADSAALLLPVSDIAVSPDGSQLALGSDTNYPGQTWLVSTASLSVTDSLSIGGNVRFSPDGAYLLATFRNRLARIDLTTRDVSAFSLSTAVPYWNSPFALHPTQSIAYVAYGDGIRIVDYLSGEVLVRGVNANSAVDVSLDLGRNRVLAAGVSLADVATFDASTLQQRARAPAAPANGVTASLDGTRIYVVGGNQVRVYGPSLARPLETLALIAGIRIDTGADGSIFVASGTGLYVLERQ